jgi:hypothetical protein
MCGRRFVGVSLSTDVDRLLASLRPDTPPCFGKSPMPQTEAAPDRWHEVRYPGYVDALANRGVERFVQIFPLVQQESG